MLYFINFYKLCCFTINTCCVIVALVIVNLCCDLFLYSSVGAPFSNFLQGLVEDTLNKREERGHAVI